MHRRIGVQKIFPSFGGGQDLVEGLGPVCQCNGAAIVNVEARFEPLGFSCFQKGKRVAAFEFLHGGEQTPHGIVVRISTPQDAPFKPGSGDGTVPVLHLEPAKVLEPHLEGCILPKAINAQHDDPGGMAHGPGLKASFGQVLGHKEGGPGAGSPNPQGERLSPPGGAGEG